MKKLVLAALAIAAMAACTKSNVQYEQPGEIAFQPVAQKATKATYTSVSYPTTEKFNVWAWWDDSSANDAPSYTDYEADLYISEGEFTLKTGTSWGGTDPYYWPTTGSLVFAGYSPASAKTDPSQFSYDLNTKTFKATNYVQSRALASTTDLMWFDVTDNSYNNNANKNSQDKDVKGVPVVFKHALSWLTFQFKLKDANVPEKWEITNVMLTGIEDKATFTAVKNAPPSWTTPEYSLNGTDKDKFTVFKGSHTVTKDAAVLEGINTGSTGSIDAGSVIVIPQLCGHTTDAALVITYNLTGTPGYVLEDQTVTLPLNVNGGEWLLGTHYIYTVTFGDNEIFIVPEVTAWTPENVADIPVQ